MMRITVAVAAVAAVVFATGGAALVGGQVRAAAADEAAIRSLIAASDAGKPMPGTADNVFWSGAYKRPRVGHGALTEEASGPLSPSHRVPGSQQLATKVLRLEIAASGDLAYEYSDGTLSFDLKSREHIDLPVSSLRVWKKEAGQWKVAAHFQHAHDAGRQVQR